MDGSQGSAASTPHRALLPGPAAFQPLQMCFHSPEWLFPILSHSGMSAWQVSGGRAPGRQQSLGACACPGRMGWEGALLECGLLLSTECFRSQVTCDAYSSVSSEGSDTPCSSYSCMQSTSGVLLKISRDVIENIPWSGWDVDVPCWNTPWT